MKERPHIGGIERLVVDNGEGATSIRVLSTSPRTSNGSGRAKDPIAKPIMAKNSAPVIAARGLSRGFGHAVPVLDSVVTRPSPEGGAVDGGASIIGF